MPDNESPYRMPGDTSPEVVRQKATITIPAEKPTFPEGARFCPSYRVGSRTALDRCLIHSAEFSDDLDPDNANRIAQDRQVETELAGLYYDGKVVIVPPKGIPCVHGAVGPFPVLFIQGPRFDAIAAEERQLLAKVLGTTLPIPGSKFAVKITDA